MRWIGLPAAAAAAALVVGAASAPRAQDAGQALGSLKGKRGLSGTLTADWRG